MKDYINIFHSIISDIHFWENLNQMKKKENFIFFNNFDNNDDLIEYFDEFNQNLSKKLLNSYLKSVINHNYGCTKT